MDDDQPGLSSAWQVPFDLGFSTIPLRPGSKRPACDWKQFQTRAASARQLSQWSAGGFNVGIVTGVASQLIVLDLDSPDAVEEAERRGLPRTLRVATPRGEHVYLRHPGAHVPNAVAMFDGADLRADGGYVVGPGSNYSPTEEEVRSGKIAGTYRWIVSPQEAELAPAPSWLLDLIAKSASRLARTSAPALGSGPHSANSIAMEQVHYERVRLAQPGCRNNTLNSAAFELAVLSTSVPVDEERIRAELTKAALAAGLEPAEIVQTIRSGWGAGVEKAEVHPTEDGIALAFSRRHGAKFIFDHRASAWYSWNSTTWIRDDRDVFELLRGIARSTGKPGLRRAGAAKGAETLARSDPAHRLPGEWDEDPMILATPKGVVLLPHGKLRPSEPTDYVTRQTSVGPEPGSPTRWLSFLDDVAGGDQELVDFIQRMCGYALTGSTSEQALFFIYGQGRNGKSVFLNTLRSILGDYAVAAAMETFTVSSFSRHPTELAMFAGARLVSAVETDQGKHWDEARIKQLTGGDAISARYMRCDFFTFTPRFKLMLVGNHKPNLRNIDAALRRRILIVPFVKQPAYPDPHLEQDLCSEHGQILNWMIEGCSKWSTDGLVAPPAVKGATEAYFSEQDGISRWLEDRCEVGCQMRGTPAELYSDWQSYAHEAGYEQGNLRAFGDVLEGLGYKRAKSNGIRYHFGVGLHQAAC